MTIQNLEGFLYLPGDPEKGDMISHYSVYVPLPAKYGDNEPSSNWDGAQLEVHDTSVVDLLDKLVAGLGHLGFAGKLTLYGQDWRVSYGSIDYDVVPHKIEVDWARIVTEYEEMANYARFLKNKGEDKCVCHRNIDRPYATITERKAREVDISEATRPNEKGCC